MLDAPRGILLKHYITLDKQSSELESYMYVKRDSVSNATVFHEKVFRQKMANEWADID